MRTQHLSNAITWLVLSIVVVETVCLNFQVWFGEWRWWVIPSGQWEWQASSAGGFPHRQRAQRGGGSISAVLFLLPPLVTFLLFLSSYDLILVVFGHHILTFITVAEVCDPCCLKIGLRNWFGFAIPEWQWFFLLLIATYFLIPL